MNVLRVPTRCNMVPKNNAACNSQSISNRFFCVSTEKNTI